jgi:P27 family predicted phage terminase small subunit
MAGRKPIPTSLQILRMSSVKAQKLMRKQIPMPGGLNDPPDWFTAEQKDEWRYAIENAPREVLKKIDKAALAAFIVAQDTHRQACEELARTGLTVKSPKHGWLMQNSYLAIVNRQAVLLIRIASELGFTPCSRARLDSANIPASNQGGGWDEIASA